MVTIGVTKVLLTLALIPDLGPDRSKLVNTGYPLPFSASVHVGNVILSGADILVLVLAPILVAGLAVFLRYTLLGTMIRAAAANPDAARLSGVSVAKVSAITWGIAGGLSAVAAILQSPSFGSNGAASGAALGPLLLLLALGAAAVGAFTSLPAALGGGLLIGVSYQIALGITSNAGTSELVVFLVIMGIVIVRGGAIGRVFSTAGAIVEDRAPLRIPEAIRDRFSVRYTPRAALAGALVLGLLLPFVPIFSSEGTRFDLALVMLYAVLSLSLTVAIGWAGQISLGQFALVGCGAFVAGHLMPNGWSVLFLLLVCGVVGAAIMALVAMPALRVPGLTLAVTTLGLAVIAPDWLFHKSWFGSAQPFGLVLNPPSLATGLGSPGSQLVTYYVALGVVVVGGAAMWALRRSQPGRLMIAVRDDEKRAATFRVTPTTVKVGALCISGFLAGAYAPVLGRGALRLAFGGQKALDGVSVEVREGEIVGLIGPNGAGKTTLLNVASGMLGADGGKVIVGGVDVSEYPPELRATYGLGRSFQQASLFPGLTVTETMQVAMSTQHRVGLLASAASAPWVRAGEGSSRKAARALLARFGLTAWADVLTD